VTFGVDVGDWVKKAKLNNEEVVRSVSLKLFTGIIKSSPVDEGTFRNNWFVSGNSPSNEVWPNNSGGSEGIILQRTETSIKQLVDWTSITFTNNLPYAEVIEYGGYPVGNIRGTESKVTFQGFSKQAPKGVVRTNSKRFNSLIEQEARKVR